jgi:hypothetical protein
MKTNKNLWLIPTSEVWKDVIGYEGIYQVSNFGNVKSLSRTITKGNITYVTKDKLLKQSVDSVGYAYVNLSDYKKQKTFRVHQLVAIAFLSHVPDRHKGLVIDHIDGNKLNNNLSNLQLLSNRENTSKDRKNKTSKHIGVYWHKECSKYASQIKINKKVKHLGLFDNEDDAYIAYQNVLQEQDKKMYSNEEVLDMLVEFSSEINNIHNITEWFEQFKKK